MVFASKIRNKINKGKSFSGGLCKHAKNLYQVRANLCVYLFSILFIIARGASPIHIPLMHEEHR